MPEDPRRSKFGGFAEPHRKAGLTYGAQPSTAAAANAPKSSGPKPLDANSMRVFNAGPAPRYDPNAASSIHEQHREQEEWRRMYGPLMSGGGVSETPWGTGNPNALPLFDPYSQRTGYGTAFTNVMELPSSAGAGTAAGLQNRTMEALMAGPVQRDVPHAELLEAQGDARLQQQDAIESVQHAGLDMASQQRELVNAAQAGGKLGGSAQAQLLAQLQGQAAGTAGPTAAQALMQSNLDRAARQQAGMAAGIRGGGAGAAALQSQRAGQDLLLQGASDVGALRAREQQAAQGLLGDVASMQRADALRETLGAAGIAESARGQDIQQAGMHAGLLGDMRGQDIDAYRTAGALGLEGRALDDAATQRNFANAQELLRLQQQGGAMDAEALLSAGRMVNDYDIGRRGMNIREAEQRNQPPWYLGPTMQAGGGFLGSIIPTGRSGGPRR